MQRPASTSVMLLLALTAVALGLSACGSGSAGTTGGAVGGRRLGIAPTKGGGSQNSSGGREASADGTAQGSAGGKSKQKADPASEPQFTPEPHHDSGGGSGQYQVKGGDNSVQEYGGEASGGEFAQAAAALHAFLDARAERAWGAACARLAASVARELVAQSAGEGRGCAAVLGGFSAGVPAAALRKSAIADVGALRAEGDQGFLLFRGAEGADFFIPVLREGGEWKIAALAPSPLS